jgi:hypothetical protein
MGWAHPFATQQLVEMDARRLPATLRGRYPVTARTSHRYPGTIQKAQQKWGNAQRSGRLLAPDNAGTDTRQYSVRAAIAPGGSEPPPSVPP